MSTFKVAGNIVNIFSKEIFWGEVVVENGIIKEIKRFNHNTQDPPPSGGVGGGFILPGFIDAHIHIESSMLVPAEFAKLAVVHGTVATVSDPHEIANVCGIQGVDYMIENGKTVPFKFNFGAPSCVPATSFETAGAVLNAADVKTLLQRDDIKYLSEMMNFPGVLHGDEKVMKKIQAAHELGKPVDGHAPGLRGEDARRYVGEGISTDHECFTKEEAVDKLQYGMKIIIREGSAAKNFEALYSLIDEYPDMIMLCSDDKHPDSLVEGHINQLCARAVAKGLNVFDVLIAACVTPALHYKLDVGLLHEGDPADFIVVDDLKHFNVQQTYINGKLVADKGKSLIVSRESSAINNFNCDEKAENEFEFHLNKFGHADEENLEQAYVVEAMDGQLITNKLIVPISSFEIENDLILANTEKDLLYMVVVNRYNNAPVAKCFVKNFGLKKGAIASSVAHDSHNIIAVGADATSICKAVNLVIGSKGGVSVVDGSNEYLLPLPVGGLMSTDDGYKVAEAYSAIDRAAKELGSTLSAPFMTLSFMGLLVIPHLKLSDLGVFDGDRFQLV
ncbi:MAG: adenine deaminase [Chitinophagaceae bacterium]|jgi:adenine deaminase|nr:adenine deaminase [Chitinophagaceae bacterium]